MIGPMINMPEKIVKTKIFSLIVICRMLRKSEENVDQSVKSRDPKQLLVKDQSPERWIVHKVDFLF